VEGEFHLNLPSIDAEIVSNDKLFAEGVAAQCTGLKP
jgi:hypothetical protein